MKAVVSVQSLRFQRIAVAVLLVALAACDGEILSPVFDPLGMEISNQEARWGDGGGPFAAQCEELADESIVDEETEGVGFVCVHPVFADKCASCHTVGDQGNVSVGNPNMQLAYDNSQEPSYTVPGETIGAACLVRIEEGSMPPGEGCTGDPAGDRSNDACLEKEQFDLIQAWLDSGQPFLPSGLD